MRKLLLATIGKRLALFKPQFLRGNSSPVDLPPIPSGGTSPPVDLSTIPSGGTLPPVDLSTIPSGGTLPPVDLSTIPSGGTLPPVDLSTIPSGGTLPPVDLSIIPSGETLLPVNPGTKSFHEPIVRGMEQKSRHFSRQRIKKESLWKAHKPSSYSNGAPDRNRTYGQRIRSYRLNF